MGQTDIVPADITDFRAAAGLPVNNPTVFTVPGTTPESVTKWSSGGAICLRRMRISSTREAWQPGRRCVW